MIRWDSFLLATVVLFPSALHASTGTVSFVTVRMRAPSNPNPRLVSRPLRLPRRAGAHVADARDLRWAQLRRQQRGVQHDRLGEVG